MLRRIVCTLQGQPDVSFPEPSPEQRWAIVDDPSLIPGAAEEILRLANSGGGGLPRYPHADIEIGGDRFDARRRPNSHPTFGYGTRFCIGAGLARLELRTTFGQICERFGHLRVAVPTGDLHSRRDVLTGGLEARPITW